MIDYRALCAELLADYEQHLYRFELIDRARAALAQPKPEVVEPTDEELNALWNCCGIADEHGHHEGNLFEFARAVLARWGHQPAPLAEGDAAEVAAWLRAYSDEEFGPHNEDPDTRWFARAADLLEQRHPTPVPVSERLPGPEDCLPWPGEPDAGRWCWMASCVDNGWAWEQRTLGFLASFPQDFTHWLPANALPLPSGEVQS